MSAKIIGVIAPTIYEASDILVEHGLDASTIQVRFLSYQQPKSALPRYRGLLDMRTPWPEVPHAD